MEASLTKSRILIARGATAAEALLIQEVKSWVDRAVADPGVLGRPFRILVPSRSLREHVSAMLVRRIRAGLAGISVQTLHGLALEILERAGRKPPRGALLVELLIRRHASSEPLLQLELGHLRDGMGTVVGTVVDFLEAGLEMAHLEALEELLCNSGPLTSIQRARAILRVAGKTLQDMERLGIGLPSTAFVWARECLEARGPGILGQRPILIHGLAEATGVASDFLETILRTSACALILDHPPRPGQWSEKDPGSAFTHRLMNRLSTHAEIVQGDGTAFHPESITMFHAPGAQAECRQVALRIQSLIRSGVRPEQIGVVARDLGPYVTAVRIHFRRLGIPFSGISVRGPKDQAGRALRALLELFRKKGECTTELWLELLDCRLGETSRFPRQELLLALRCLGAARLKEIATLDMRRIRTQWRNGYPLPLRLGLEEDYGGDVVVTRRKVPVEELHHIQQRVRAIQDALASWTQREMKPPEHLHRMEDIALKHLGWSQAHPVTSHLHRALEEMKEEIPPDVPMTQEEFLLLLDKHLEELGTVDLGGKGGGVQVLEVMEARARTFQHLFLMGMNRDFFPRPIREDPLLPDSLRRLLLPLLPDLPVKETGFEEERYLFAQIISSSHHITISWQSTDEDGKAKAVSPLVERLVLKTGIAPLRAGRISWEDPPNLPIPCLRPAQEQAIRLGLQGHRELLEPALATCLKMAFGEEITWMPAHVASARLAILNEMDPDLKSHEGRITASRPGPYMGFIGPILVGADPRRLDPYVTSLESMASCPWRTLLRGLLRLEPPQDPLEALPEVTRLELGSLVHAVLERVVAHHLGPDLPRSLEQAVKRPPRPVPWPAPTELERLLDKEAQRLLLEQGVSLPGLGQVLTAQAMPYIQVANQVDWPPNGSPIQVLSVEVEGQIQVQGDPEVTTVRFRVDRVDLTPRGLLLTDYKVGKSFSYKARQETRSRHLLQAVARGERLQAVAYAMATAGGRPAVGRYLFLDPNLPDHSRVFQVEPGQTQFMEAFGRALSAVLSAWRMGIFFPRLVKPDGRKEPDRCRHCDVSMACLRGDSGARARLLRWAEAAAKGAPSARSLESAFLALWRLPEVGREESQEERGES